MGDMFGVFRMFEMLGRRFVQFGAPFFQYGGR
jgi:hypothetical protein